MSRASTEARAGAGEADAEVARWLVEVGRRRWPKGAGGAEPVSIGFRTTKSILHRVALLGVLAAAIFQYLYLDVLLQVSSLPSLIVFVLAGGRG